MTSFSCHTEPRAELLCASVVSSNRNVKVLIAIKPEKRGAVQSGWWISAETTRYTFFIPKSQTKPAVQPCLQVMSVVLAEHLLRTGKPGALTKLRCPVQSPMCLCSVMLR